MSEHVTFFKSGLTTRAEQRGKTERETTKQRRSVYLLVEQRDGRRCRACLAIVSKVLTVGPKRLEHHHILGRGGVKAETSANICVLCKTCHDDRHVKRILKITGNADGLLCFERAGQKWHG